ncbi:class II histone deacetylase [uncultured Sphingomonas sp.]|uniref:class II histone deacetylase n=1 Tax=uncultured Sphingomonas sp. TaxID=158754 RepID=UPI0035CA7060
MTGRTGFYTDERTFWHGGTAIAMLTLPVGGWVQPPGGTVGVDTPDTKRRLLNLLRASGLLDRLDQIRAAPVSEVDLLRVHPPAYLRRFKAMSDAGGGSLGIAADFGPGGYEIAAISAGLARQAVDDVLAGRVANGYALCRPCGHHCLPEEAMGSCLFANIAVAIEAALAKHGPRRIAVVDWDVHHGNGTQAIFYARGDVLTISLHQDGCFPFGYGGAADRGAGAGDGCNINVPLPAGAGHDAYLHAIDRIVTPALHRFAPDLVIVASGLDASIHDPMGRMLAHSDTFRDMTRRLKQAAADLCDGRLVVVHEGGYSEAHAPFCGHAIVEVLAGVAPIVGDPALAVHQAQQPGPRATAFHRALIDEWADAIERDPRNGEARP